MMPINNCNNDQNIARNRTKMSENFSDETKEKLVASSNCLEKRKDNNSEESALKLSYDHMYTTNSENGQPDLPEPTCQDAESEVKFLKDWLILHLDLIQQQNDEILNKERTILILQQENEMLKERITCLERGAPFQPRKFFGNHNTPFLDEGLDMTQDSNPCDEDNKNCLELLDLNCENGDPVKDKLSESPEHPSLETKFNPQVNYNISDKLNVESDITNCNNRLEFTVDNSGEFDPMRNLRMSIRRKRLSNSSALSNNDSVLDEKHSFRKFKKRRKRMLKDPQILMTPEHYVTEANKTNLRLTNVPDVTVDMSEKNLEVPRWRIKVYASCYQMEGTENLDDEVYNKRHSRLENDERRRKRWDVQRIREQRLVEKLKQRQERVGSRTDEQTDSMQSLWPTVEDIKYLEVSDHLPVSAFGSPVPKILSSEFSLPWLNNPGIAAKKPPTKRSMRRRRR